MSRLLQFALLLVAVCAGAADAKVLPGYAQCGGDGKKGIADAPKGTWKGFSCGVGYICKAQNAHYSQCVPGKVSKNKPVALPKRVKNVKGCTYIVDAAAQCGGFANVPKGIKIRPGGRWLGVCCQKGYKCKVQNKFYSQCMRVLG